MSANGRDRPTTRRLAAVLTATLTLAILSIVTVHAGGATAIGAALSAKGGVNAIELLGTKPAMDGCVSAPLAVGAGNAVYCRTWGGVTSTDGVVEVVSIFSEDTSVVDAYTGTLPQGLHWGDSIKDVTARLGQPARITPIYGTPTFVYMFKGFRYGSLELRFSSGDRLSSINACLTR
jgi:hypothetical protein